MLAFVPPNVLVEVTEIPFATLRLAKVPVPFNVTSSEQTTPLNEPEIIAAFVLSYILLLAAGLVIVKAFAPTTKFLEEEVIDPLLDVIVKLVVPAGVIDAQVALPVEVIVKLDVTLEEPPGSETGLLKATVVPDGAVQLIDRFVDPAGLPPVQVNVTVNVAVP